jgi:hypothetical protein
MFIFLQKDAFLNKARGVGDDLSNSKSLARKNGSGGLGKYSAESSVRRPTRGIQIKEDTYAVLTIRRADGRAIPLTSSSAGGSDKAGVGRVDQYSDFILQQINDERMEKEQIVETFGDPYVFFFGERPRVASFSGMLMNTEDFNWRSQFWANYNESLRGTRLVQENARAYLCYDNLIIEGYPLRAAAQDTSDQPYLIPFQMSMLVTDVLDQSAIGKTAFPGSEFKRDYNALNRELNKRRSAFESTTAEVRFKNLDTTPGGFLSAMRKGISAINEATTWASYQMSLVTNTIAGRNVRVPVGVAGYLTSIGAPEFTWGSVDSSVPLSAWDAATGKYKNVSGSVQIRMPPAAQFGASWVTSAYSGVPQIYENYDEYPQLTRNLWDAQNREDYVGEVLTDLIPAGAAVSLEERRMARKLAMKKEINDAKLWESIHGGGGLLGTIADGVAFAKSAFGMLMTASSFIQDPKAGFYALTGYAPNKSGLLSAATGGLLGGNAGISNGYTPASNINSETRKKELAAAGIKVKSSSPSTLDYLGLSSPWRSFQTAKNNITKVIKGESLEVEPEEQEVGQAYKNTAYVATPTAVIAANSASSDPNQILYENVVNNKNLDPLAEILGTEGTRIIAEGSGSTDDASADSLSDLNAVSKTTAVTTKPTSAQSADALELAYGSEPSSDEDTSGIRGIDDVDTTISPVI